PRRSRAGRSPDSRRTDAPEVDRCPLALPDRGTFVCTDANASLALATGGDVKHVTADDGVQIAYDAWGRKDGPPVLLIQGLGMDSRGGALQRMALGRHYRCLAPADRGAGDTVPVA